LTGRAPGARLIEHSEKEGAAGNWKGGFGFTRDPDGSEDALAGLFRSGNAGADTQRS